MSNYILYTTGCPKCRILEKKLNDKQIKFDVCNDTEKMREIGITSVPTLSVDDNKLNYYDAVKHLNSL
jgi:predicted DsbA family dithiol-disulfide isomerase